MNFAELSAAIQNLLKEAIGFDSINITDDSYKHIGHAGRVPGKFHLSLEISSSSFADKSKIAQHRMIYQALAPIFNDYIHALKIDSKV